MMNMLGFFFFFGATIVLCSRLIAKWSFIFYGFYRMIEILFKGETKYDQWCRQEVSLDKTILKNSIFFSYVICHIQKFFSRKYASFVGSG